MKLRFLLLNNNINNNNNNNNIIIKNAHIYALESVS